MSCSPSVRNDTEVTTFDTITRAHVCACHRECVHTCVSGAFRKHGGEQHITLHDSNEVFLHDSSAVVPYSILCFAYRAIIVLQSHYSSILLQVHKDDTAIGVANCHHVQHGCGLKTAHG